MNIVFRCFAFFGAALLISCATTEKSRTGLYGFEAADRDVKSFSSHLRLISDEEVIGSFIPEPDHQIYGSYEYYWGYMANFAVKKELQRRGTVVLPALKDHSTDSTDIAEGINGPRETIGSVCLRLIEALQPKTPNQTPEPTPGTGAAHL